MAPKVFSACTPSYDKIEPFCSWQRQDERDVLVLHLPEFKKDQLRVQINSYGILKISGEGLVNGAKKSYLYKEFAVPKNCFTDDIRARFVRGCLYISMPKRVVPAAEQLISRDQSSEFPHHANTSTLRDLETNQQTTLVSRTKRCVKVVLILAAICIVLAAVSAFCVYIFRKTVFEA